MFAVGLEALLMLAPGIVMAIEKNVAWSPGELFCSGVVLILAAVLAVSGMMTDADVLELTLDPMSDATTSWPAGADRPADRRDLTDTRGTILGAARTFCSRTGDVKLSTRRVAELRTSR